MLTMLRDCLVPVNLSTLFDGQRQQALRNGTSCPKAIFSLT